MSKKLVRYNINSLLENLIDLGGFYSWGITAFSWIILFMYFVIVVKALSKVDHQHIQQSFTHKASRAR